MGKRLIFSTYWIALSNIALAALIGYSSVEFWLLIKKPPLTIHYSSNTFLPIKNETQISHSALDISGLLQARLFGKSSYKKQIATQSATQAPKTNLKLKLHGIYYSSNSEASFAMITTPNGKSKPYHVNESLPGGILIHEILPKHVILLRNRRYESLHLIGYQENKGSQTKRGNAKNMHNTPISNKSPEKLLGYYQKQLQTRPNRLMKLMRISPAKQNGRLIGYRLRQGKEPGLLSRFNLQSGDILTTINGVKLDSPLKGLGVIQKLGTARQIDIEVLRNGETIFLSFAVEK
jgi:general secretion pathway protein C